MLEVIINGVKYIPEPPKSIAKISEVERVLACPIEYEYGLKTIRDYLWHLLDTLWQEEESFSGKRPFGNSDWQTTVLCALATEGLISAEIDDDGYLDDISSDEESKGKSLIRSAIAHIFYESKTPIED